MIVANRVSKLRVVSIYRVASSRDHRANDVANFEKKKKKTKKGKRSPSRDRLTEIYEVKNRRSRSLTGVTFPRSILPFRILSNSTLNPEFDSVKFLLRQSRETIVLHI